jgi:hypothetical protein
MKSNIFCLRISFLILLGLLGLINPQVKSNYSAIANHTLKISDVRSTVTYENDDRADRSDSGQEPITGSTGV